MTAPTSPPGGDRDGDGDGAGDASALSCSRATFRERAGDADADDRPVVVRVTAAIDTTVDPLTAYAALVGDESDAARASAGDTRPRGSDDGYLLESADKVASSDPDGAFSPEDADRHARFSFVGYDPAAVVTVDDGATAIDVRDARYESLLSTDGDTDAADAVADADADVLDRLRAAMPSARLAGFPDVDRQRLSGGLVGYLAYDAVYDLFLDEVGVDRPATTPVPDAQFLLSDRVLAIDHRDDAAELVYTPVLGPDDDAGAVYDALAADAAAVRATLADATLAAPGGFVRYGEQAGPRDAYEAAVRRAKTHVRDGDIYQGVISRKRELYGEIDPRGLYAALREINPSPYMYLYGVGDRAVVGASPETLVSVRGREVMANPIAGTTDRGTSPVEDRRLAGEMLADGKERAEHTMLVDLARNDVRRVSTPGSVTVDEFMNVLKYSHVQHIESTVTGRLHEDRDAFDATRAAFPAGTLSGAPKVRAMEIIDALEDSPRGVYGGGVGYYDWTGDADVAIVIRTATVERDIVPPEGLAPTRSTSDAAPAATAEPSPTATRTGHDHAAGDAATPSAATAADRVTVRAGAGIVADSVPEREFRETEQKMRGVLAAIEAIETAAGDDDGDGDGDADDPDATVEGVST